VEVNSDESEDGDEQKEELNRKSEVFVVILF
jgi:hypothetical protein